MNALPDIPGNLTLQAPFLRFLSSLRPILPGDGLKKLKKHKEAEAVTS